MDLKYQKGKIYTIRNKTDDDLIYVGSTIDTLPSRFYNHKADCKRRMNYSLYYYIENNDWTDWYIELYEKYPCNDRQELHKREGQVIREIGTINKCITGRTDAEYRKEMKEIIAKKMVLAGKKYREKNKEVLSDRFKEWYDKNKSLVLEPRKDKCVCDICGCNVSKGWLREHKKTKKCMTTSNNYEIKKLPIIMENP